MEFFFRKRIEKREIKVQIEKGNKSPSRKKTKKVQIKKGNKSSNRNWKM